MGGDERIDIYIWRTIWGSGGATFPDWQVPDTNGPGTYTSYIEVSPNIRDWDVLRSGVARAFEEALDPASLRQRRTRVNRSIPPLSGTWEALMTYWEGVALADSGRPEPGPDFVHSDNFVIHFNPGGEHAAPRAYAESVAVYAEEAWRTQVDSLGRTPPRPDRGRGGDDRYDIYLRNLQHLNTYLGREQHVPGPAQPDTVHASYIIVKRDVEFWDTLRGAVLGVFDRALKAAIPSSSEKPEKQD
ncbi:MAG TPA: hypothetical protein ENN51_02930 [candidate division WOR-3 bacterium]|uniref:Uncharacterized protein n=1 Tax=candidate division WOR-3 bacterium TaxID=2052148 RepID=A0A7V0T4V3_UNCW3|nr:hypothetical protein [candidate division WOR-3 bacterium]